MTSFTLSVKPIWNEMAKFSLARIRPQILQHAGSGATGSLAGHYEIEMFHSARTIRLPLLRSVLWKEGEAGVPGYHRRHTLHPIHIRGMLIYFKKRRRKSARWCKRLITSTTGTIRRCSVSASDTEDHLIIPISIIDFKKDYECGAKCCRIAIAARIELTTFVA
jgi:hypothetical protein